MMPPKMSSYLTLVTADRSQVRVSLERRDTDTASTVLASWTFDRLTADIHLLWTVQGREALSVAERLAFAFRALKLTKKIV